MSVYMSIIVFGIVFAGETFIPEDPLYPGPKSPDGYVAAGRKFTFGGEPLWEIYENEWGPSRHFTVVFAVFVYMQVFNMICARKINDEKNIFAGFCSNSMYVSILFIIAIVQFILTQFSADIFKCS